tara:strand:- start:96 stop:242 length:147 start_codon:yes stop_codon:yes gene_type:complete
LANTLRRPKWFDDGQVVAFDVAEAGLGVGDGIAHWDLCHVFKFSKPGK